MKKFMEQAEAYRRFSDDGGLHIISVGYNDFSDLKPNTSSWIQNYYTLHFVISGRGVLEIYGKEYHPERGDVFLIPPETEIFYAPLPEEPWEYVWFSFHGEDAADIAKRIGFENPVMQHKENYGKICCAFKRILDPSETESGYYGVLAAFYEVLEIVMTKPNDAEISAVKKMIDDHFTMCDFNITQLVQEAHISHAHLIRLFKDAYDTTPVKYLKGRRIERAKELLLTTSLSVKSVALSCGFSDEIHFMKMFKKMTGMSALTYRKSKKDK